MSFILEARYQGEPRVVADGVAFPSGQIAVDWRNESGTELIPNLESLYDKYGQSPRVLWEHADGTFSESEPAALINF